MEPNLPTPDASDDLAHRTLLEKKHHLSPSTHDYYIDEFFVVPENARRVGLVLTFHKERLAQIYVSLHDPTEFRGNRMNPSGKGDIVLELWVSPEEASPGGIAGALPAGEWRAQLQIARVGEETDYHLEVYADLGKVSSVDNFTYPAGHIVNSEAGWYQGELHCHSTESDGKYPAEAVVRTAREFGLDFLALTDHFTISQWRKIAAVIDEPIALLRSCEITSALGHANLHGIQRWVNVFVDRPGWDMNQAAQATHAQGALFCVNHAFNLELGWRADGFNWDLADLMEVYHNLEGPNNDAAITMWDHHLQLGRRIVGIGGTDSHDPFWSLDRLAQVVTCVYATELSEQGIINGLRQGLVYVTKGPELRFTASNPAGEQVQMWESLPLGNGPINFQVKIKNTEPLNLVVMKNGYPAELIRVEAGDGEWQTIEFSDEPTLPAYYRVELHKIALNETYAGLDWRDYSTIQALTNPIWVGRA
jgi:hypothetical protein